MASPPQNLSVNCRFDNISSSSFISITWAHPDKPNGVITRYNIQLTGSARFKNDMGRLDIDTWGPQIWSVYKKNSTHFNQTPPNTNYTVRVHGVTRSRTQGKDAVGNCTTPVTVPDRDSLNMRSWRKIENQGKQLFKLYLPRITERNGPICCYRVYLIKLAPQKSVTDLPPPEELGVYSYQYAHSSSSGGAYVAETFDSDRLISEIFLGDGETFNGSSMCKKCIGLRPKASPPVLHFVPEVPTTTPTLNTTTPAATTTVASTTTPATTTPMGPTQRIETTMTNVVDTNETETPGRRRRDNMATQKTKSNESPSELPFLVPQDGFLDEKSNYTGFIEVIGTSSKLVNRLVYISLKIVDACNRKLVLFLVFGDQEDQLLPAYSNYFNALYGGLDPVAVVSAEVTTLSVILKISIALILIIIILLVALCVLHRYTKRAQQRGEEIITLRNSFR